VRCLTPRHSPANSALPLAQAIGWAAAPDSDNYLTPDYRSVDTTPCYVSMGGAGFIYPARARASKGYGEGDKVRTELDFIASRVRFWVNDELVADAAWEGGDVAYPAIASQGPNVDCLVK
jgi:hypothetical protein